jgi:hypothetical protein
MCKDTQGKDPLLGLRVRRELTTDLSFAASVTTVRSLGTLKSKDYGHASSSTVKCLMLYDFCANVDLCKQRRSISFS